MDFAPTEAQRDAVAAAETFARRVLAAPDGKALGGDEPTLDRPLMAECGRFGLTGLLLPEAWGGQGHDALTAALVLEACGREAAGTGALFGVAAHLTAVAVPVLVHGAPAQHERWLRGLAEGTLVGAFAASEPEAGSDAGAIRTRARSDGAGGWVLDGAKTYVTNAPFADVFIVSAVVGGDGATAREAFLVPADGAGVSVAPPLEKMGLAGAPMAEVRFDEVALDADARLGEAGQGGAVFRTAMTWERALVLAPQVGAMAANVARGIEHARTRKQFGQRIGRKQAVAHGLARASLQVELARLALHRAAWSLDEGGRAPLAAGHALPRGSARWSALGKLAISEEAVRVHEAVLRVLAGAGYVGDTAAGRELRDAYGTLFHSGTPELQLELVAALLGLG